VSYSDPAKPGNGLYSYHKNGEILITSRFERREESFWLEMASIETKHSRVSQIKEENIVIQ
jgi:hypothetical protein